MRQVAQQPIGFGQPHPRQRLNKMVQIVPQCRADYAAIAHSLLRNIAHFVQAAQQERKNNAEKSMIKPD